MSQDKILLVGQIIHKTLQELEIPEAIVVFSSSEIGGFEATVSYEGKEKKISFTREEIENLNNKNFCVDINKRIFDALSNLAPRVGPSFTPSK